MTNNNAVSNVQFLSQIDHLALQDPKVTESIDLLYIMNHQCFSEKISLEFYLKSVTHILELINCTFSFFQTILLI